MTTHLNEFTLLRLNAGELAGEEFQAAGSHLDSCVACEHAMGKIRDLDSALRELAADEFDILSKTAFSPTDPFRQRPALTRPSRSRAVGGADVASWTAASFDAARTIQNRILAARQEPEQLLTVIGTLSLAEPTHRFALLYALQESGRRIAEDPLTAAGLARSTLKRLVLKDGASASAQTADWMVPLPALIAQAHTLAAQADIWTKDFKTARSHLTAAYTAFALAGDETGLAIVELNESQRRALAGEGTSALALARRALNTFECCGLEDQAARALVAEGLACFALNRFEASIRAYRKALQVFERYELWANYVGALNSVATSLHTLGRLDEARRDYARAFRRLSRKEHRSWLGFLRAGLGEILFAASRYEDAAISAARAAQLFSESGLGPNALMITLLEIEAWARAGRVGRAHRRLQWLSAELGRIRPLDPVVTREIEDAMAGTDPNFERLYSLRQELCESLLASSKR